MAYCTVEDVQAVLSRYPIDDTTQPTFQQVAKQINFVSARLDGILAGQGYSIPITGSQSLATLQEITVLGAGFWTARQMFPNATAGIVIELRDEYERQLTDLEDETIAMIDAGKDATNVALSAYDALTLEDQCATQPFITRSMQF